MTSTRKELIRALREDSIRRYLRKVYDEQAIAGLRGKTIVFEYPKSNRDLQPLTYTTRLFRVDDADDFARAFGGSPDDEAAAERDPLLRRLGKLIRGVDLVENRTKTFYYGAMRRVHEATPDEILELLPKPIAVLLVERPTEWEPRDNTDVPPSVELHRQPTPRLANVFARRFNDNEMADSCGWWAVNPV